MKLLYRSNKKSDEFIVDYIIRMSQKNGFLEPNRFKKYLRSNVENYLDGGSCYLLVESKLRLGLELSLSRNIAIDEHKRVTSSECILWRNKPIVCNKCFESEQYIRFYWWIASYKKCHIHNIDLSEARHNCEVKPRDMLGDYLVKKLPEFLAENLNYENCQRITIDALEHSWCDFEIANGLRLYFNKDKRIAEALSSLDRFLHNQSLSNKNESERICAIASFLSSRLGEYAFWSRVICLLIFNLQVGLKSNFPVNQVAGKYLRASIFYLSNDIDVFNYRQKFINCAGTQSLSSIPLGNLLPKNYSYNAEFVKGYEFSLVRCGSLDYFSQCLGSECVFRTDNSIMLKVNKGYLYSKRSI